MEHTRDHEETVEIIEAVIWHCGFGLVVVIRRGACGDSPVCIAMVHDEFAAVVFEFGDVELIGCGVARINPVSSLNISVREVLIAVGGVIVHEPFEEAFAELVCC